jgi:hypothetical protein
VNHRAKTMFDKDLPNYECQEYRELKNKWELCELVYDSPDPDDLDDFRKFLPPEPKEPIEAYLNRLKASAFLWEDKYRQVVDEYAALLSNVHTTDDIPQTLSDRLENIDQIGTSLDSFVQSLNLTTEVYGGSFILVDYQGTATAESAADELGNQRSPYLIKYDPEEILSWRFEYIGGKPVLVQVVIKQETLVPDGDYGETELKQYRVLKPGISELWEIRKDDDGKERAVMVEERIVTDRSNQPLSEIPLVYYSVRAGELFCAEPALYGLAKLNIHLWQLESDRHNVMHKCNLPTLAIGDTETFNPDGTPANSTPILGPNHYIKHTPEGRAYFVEPAGTALAATKAKVDDVKQSMERIGLGFLLGTASATATQSLIQATGTQASIKGMARQLNSALAEIKRLWCLFTLEEDSGELTVDDSLIQAAINAEMARFIVELMDGGKLSYETGMSELQKGKIISEDIDIAIEAEKLGLSIGGAAPAISPATIPPADPNQVLN